MTDSEFRDTMESLQLSGHLVKWFVHKPGRFSKSKGFHSRSIAEQFAVQNGLIVTPDFT